MVKKYQDGIQGTIEAGLLNAFGSDPTFRARVDDEQLTGATMLRHNIFYDEAKERVQQALKNLHGLKDGKPMKTYPISTTEKIHQDYIRRLRNGYRSHRKAQERELKRLSK